MSAAAPEPQQRVEQLERELAQARLALEDFTYSVSHDLRASLRHVISYLRIAREDLGDGLDPAVSAHLDTAAGAAAQMGRLMDGLMELSRVGRAVMQQGEVDLVRMVDDLRRTLQDKAEGRQIVWSIAPDLPRVRGDMAMLSQMLGCLLDNAMKFSRDSASSQIAVQWNLLEHGLCEIHIQDNGVGFDPRMQDRLFRVFQSLHSARQFDGIGVGLALARRVVERHGGQIRASSGPGLGCRVSLSLPLARVADQVAGAPRTSHA